MEWVQAIEQRLNAAIAESQSGEATLAQSDFVILAPFDMVKLITAVRFATSKLREIDENASDIMALTIAGQSLTQLQIGEFREGAE